MGQRAFEHRYVRRAVTERVLNEFGDIAGH
jgi:hypothetical protein